MKTHRLFASIWPVVAVLASSSIPTEAFAVAENWQVGRVTGQAWINAGPRGRTDLSLGMGVQPGVTIFTGDRSRLMLLRGTEAMVLGPRSVVAVSEHPTEGLSTTILEKAGSVSFDVERENVKHFSVETPMLAAVVKGTHFTVNVARADGRVSVSRGTVQVTALATGQVTNVTVGQRASVGRAGLSVSGRGLRAGISVGRPRASVVSAVAPGVPTASPVNAVTAAETAAVASVSASAATTSDSGVSVGGLSPAMAHAEGPTHASSTSSSATHQTTASASVSVAASPAVSAVAHSSAGVTNTSVNQAGPGASLAGPSVRAGAAAPKSLGPGTTSPGSTGQGPRPAGSGLAGTGPAGTGPSGPGPAGPAAPSAAAGPPSTAAGAPSGPAATGVSVSVGLSNGGLSVSVGAGGVTTTVGLGGLAAKTGLGKSDNGRGNNGTPGAGHGSGR